MATGRGHQRPNSPFLDQRERGFSRLRFSGFVEEEFLQFYAHSNVQRARLILGIAICVVLVSLGAQLASGNAHWVTVGYYAVCLLPIMGLTAWLSTEPKYYRSYQFMLALSILLIGMIVSSLVLRQNLAGFQYYFGAMVAWLFVDWLIVGLPFRHAARTSAIISIAYVWGLYHWQVPAQEFVFSTVLLVFANFVAALCCYQLEQAMRQSFLESKVLGQLAERDGLTGLYNRRSYDEFIQRIWRQSRREHMQVTLLLIDIDHFKTFNDLYGHQAGDDALKQVAEVIAASAKRPLDFAARYGGEEFALLLYGPASEYGQNVPDAIRSAVEDLKISHKGSTTAPYLTVSIGVAIVMPGTDRSLTGAVQMADEALYQAKEDGRNQIVVRESVNSQVQTGNFRAPSRATA